MIVEHYQTLQNVLQYVLQSLKLQKRVTKFHIDRILETIKNNFDDCVLCFKLKLNFEQDFEILEI